MRRFTREEIETCDILLDRTPKFPEAARATSKEIVDAAWEAYEAGDEAAAVRHLTRCMTSGEPIYVYATWVAGSQRYSDKICDECGFRLGLYDPKTGCKRHNQRGFMHVMHSCLSRPLTEAFGAVYAPEE